MKDPRKEDHSYCRGFQDSLVTAERQWSGTVEGAERPNHKRKLNHTLRMILPDIERTDPASLEDCTLSSTGGTEGVARYR
ncbi:hypothetical protein GCM10010415_48840 [Streptomyces atrovirens]